MFSNDILLEPPAFSCYIVSRKHRKERIIDMYRNILFDLDGTLTDSREGIFKSIRYALTKLGREVPSEETLLRFVGPPLPDSFERYCHMTNEEAWHAVEVFRERYEAIGWAENRAADGMVELMQKLTQHGCKLAIASSKPECSVIPIAEKFGFMPYLTAACGSWGKSEAKVDVIRDALERLGISEAEKSDTVMVGDRIFDVEGAALCGLACVGVEFFNFAPPGELANSAAIAVCSTVQELEHVLLGN